MSLTATTVAAGLAELEQLARAFDPEATVAAAAQLLQSPELIGRARGRALYLYGRALYRIERFPQGTEAMRQAQETYSEAGDEENAQRCQLGMSQEKMQAGLYPEAQHLVAKVLAVAERQGWDELHAEAQVEVGLICNREHRYREALANLYPAAEYFDQAPASPRRRDAQDALAWAETGAGLLEEGRQRAEALFTEFEAQGRPLLWQALTLNTLIFNAWCRGDFEDLWARQARLLELGQQMSPTRPRQLMVVHYNTAVCETQLGRYLEAKRSLHRSWDIARRAGDGHLLPAIQMLLSLLAVHENRPDMALEYAQLARSNAREFESDEAVLIGWYLALALLAADHPREALQEWQARRPLEASIENWLELGWFRRAFQHLARHWSTGNPAHQLALSIVEEWETELAALQATYPAPPALAR